MPRRLPPIVVPTRVASPLISRSLDEAEARRAVAGVRQHDRLGAKAFAYRQHHPLAIGVAVALDKIVTAVGARSGCAVAPVVQALLPRVDMLHEIVGHTPRADTPGDANRRDCLLDQSREDRIAAVAPLPASVLSDQHGPPTPYAVDLHVGLSDTDAQQAGEFVDKCIDRRCGDRDRAADGGGDR